jgi:hypothetical protein
MFDPTSRYVKIPTATLEVPEEANADGTPRTIRYVRRRFLPSPEGMTTLVEHTVAQDERLDNITARYLDDPTLFWRVCDANTVLNPEEVVEEPGTVLRIALPQS